MCLLNIGNVKMKVKVREIESHNQSVAVVGAGQRAALKLAGCSLDEVGRGMCLSAENYGVSSNVWEAVILWKKVFPSGTRIRLHMGTGEFIGRISYKKNNGESTSIARLHLESLVSGGMGDQGIVRRYSPQDLIGGVIFLKPAIGNHKLDDGLERLSAALLHRNQKEVMYELLRMSSVPPGWIEWRRLAGYTNTISVHAAVDSLIAEEKVRQAGNYYMTNGQFLAFQSRMRQELAENHRQKPDEPGISKETLRKRINLPENISDWFFQKGVHSGLINIRDEYVADKFHAEVHGQSMAQLQEVFERNMDVTELIEVTPQWLSEKLSCSPEEIKPFFETLVRQKILVRIAGVHVYRKTIQYIGSIIQKHFASHSTLSAGEFRDLMKTSRRLAIPVLEYFDSNNYTIRQNEGRRPGPKLKNLSE